MTRLLNYLASFFLLPIFHSLRHKPLLEGARTSIPKHQTTMGTRTHVHVVLTCFRDDIGVCVPTAQRPWKVLATVWTTSTRGFMPKLTLFQV
jgi:hypothetical protein